MSTTITPNLKLRKSRDLDADSKFNLDRIDTVGAAQNVNPFGDLLLRAVRNIILEPQNADVGGSGAGGQVNLGTEDHTLALVQLYAAVLKILGDLQAAGAIKFLDADESNFVALQAPSVVPSDVTFTLPSGDGLSGQVLQTDGSGALSWASVATADELAATWIAADGATKVVPHSLNSKDLLVQVYSNVDDATVDVEVARTSLTSVTLTSAQIPPAAGYRVLIREIQ